jgi:hypothetical protein
MTCASAAKLKGEQPNNSSPQGAFILIGDFPGGEGLLVVMLLCTPHSYYPVLFSSFLSLGTLRDTLPSFLFSFLTL